VDVENFAIRLLGSFEVERNGSAVAIPAGRQRTVLSLLALQAGRAVSTDVIAEHLWGEEPPPSARATLRGYVLRLRRALTPRGVPREHSVIGTGRNSYWLEATPDSVDTYRFKSLTAEAATAGDPGREADLLGQALSLWRGPALCDVTGEVLHREVVPSLDEERIQALQRSAELRMARGEHSQVVAELRGLVARHPLRDGLWGLLMMALYGAGHQSEALLQYERCRKTMAEALGVDPDPRVRELHRQILTDDPTLRAARPSARWEAEKATTLPPACT
jgi:DNA-binding SARP family transcriptional activator